MQVLNAGFDRLWENNNKGVRILLKSAFVGIHDKLMQAQASLIMLHAPVPTHVIFHPGGAFAS